MKKTIITSILLVLSVLCFGQNENNYWFFGANAGLDFSSGMPVNIAGSLNTFEGCASIADENGNLLFYTDGRIVYNAIGDIMTNGTGLLGHPSSTSSAIIVPIPSKETEYYVFTVDFNNSNNGLKLNLIDMDDNGDCIFTPGVEFGSVVIKNQDLPGPTGEKVCAIKKANGVDFWVIATKQYTNNYYVYEVTKDGVNPAPSPFNIQSVGDSMHPLGYLKASPNGTKLARANFSPHKAYIYDFDNSTGQISNQIEIGSTPINTYGVEFSPDSKKLYYTDIAYSNGNGTGQLYQVDIFPTVSTPILIGTMPNNGVRYALGALQLTPESPQRILIANDGTFSLAAINNPNVGGASNFVPNAITLDNECQLGLPTFVSGRVDGCEPLAMQGFFNAVPDLFSDTIKNEIVSGGATDRDKEYGDIDNDRDADILYTKNNSLYVLSNIAFSCGIAEFSLSAVSLGIDDCYSFRLYDWNNDGWNDLVVLGEYMGNSGVWLYLNDGTGQFSGAPTLLLDGMADFPFNNNHLIEIGDLNGDAKVDLLISGQGSIDGTAYFENTGSASFPYFSLVAPQVFSGGNISPVFLPNDGGSLQSPELYDADCQFGLDVLVSDPMLSGAGGGRVYFHENQGGFTSDTLPNVEINGVPNSFGFNDMSGSSDLDCDLIITRMVDFFRDDCPIALAYNPCTDEMYFYFQECLNSANVCLVQTDTVYGISGELASFEVNSNQEGACTWDFGDGNTSTDCDATHTYASPGVYSTTLTFDDGADCQKTISSAAIIACPTGNITFTSQAQIDAYPFACPFTGNVTISGNDISNLDDFSVVTSIPGDLTIDGNMMLDNTSGLMNIDSIGGHIYITDNDSMTDAPAFDSLDYVGGCIEITGNGAMTDISGFGNLNYVFQYITISGNGSLSSLTGFTELDSLGGDISIQDNVNIINVSGFSNVIFIGGHFYLNNNTNLNNLSGFGSLTTVNNCMEITNNNALENLQWFTGLTSIGNVNDSDNSYLLISGNGSMTDLTGFENITFIFGSLTIQDNPVLTSLGGLNNTFLGSNSITNISIQNCPELIICQVPCVCDVIMNGGEAIIMNNAEGCNTPEQVDANCSLPIELLYLKVTQYQNNVLLTWLTATETNNSHFIIEHSIDAQQFTEVGRVAGSGTSLTPQTYSFIHERPHLGVNYYRLRQVDFDGTFEYSDIINVEFERKGFHIFPNPVESALHLQFNTSQMEIEVNITSITGKVIHSEVVDFSGGAMLITFDIENYPMGVYFLSVNDGKEIQVQRFIKS